MLLRNQESQGEGLAFPIPLWKGKTSGTLKGGYGLIILLGKGESNMRLYLNEKEAPVLMRALSLLLEKGTADEANIAQALLSKITLCQERQGYKPTRKRG